jgi:uncharacterized protein YbjT (DUF2867 family)
MSMSIRGFRPILRQMTTSTDQTRKKLVNPDGKPTVLVLGHGNLGNKVAEEAARQGHRVLITSRTKKSIQLSKNVSIVNTPESTTKDQKFWRDLIGQNIQEKGRLLVVNGIGGTHPRPGETLHDLNVKTMVSSLSGIADGVKQNKSISDLHVVHYSSIAADYSDHEYGQVKKEAEERAMSLGIDNLTALRVGYAVEPLIQGEHTNVIQNQHYYGPEQAVQLPCVPLIGDKQNRNRVMLQPVAMDDVAKATLNAAHTTGKHVIDAVGPELLTQEQFFHFFSDLLGKEFKPFYIPIETARLLAKHFSLGHFAPFAVEYCARNGIVLSPDKFEALVGDRLQTLADMYAGSDKPLEFSRPPLVKHAKQIVSTLSSSAEARKDTGKVIKTILTDCL